MMDLATIITAIGIFFGWWVTYVLSLRRDAENRRKELYTHYLIDAYRSLESAVQRKPTPGEKVESAIADIQLFGTLRQIELATDFAHKMDRGEAGLNHVLNDLRQTLRAELQLEEVSPELVFLRFDGNNQPKSS